MPQKNGNGATEAGLSIISALSVAGVWSAVNPSYFSFRAFVSDPEKRSYAITGMWIGLGLSGLAALGIGLVFKRPLPAIVAGATGVLLFGISMTAVHTNNIEEKAAETIPQRPVAGIGQTVQPEIMKVVGWPRIREVA